MTLYRIDQAQVRDLMTGNLLPGLIGQEVQIVVRDTTTPFEILDETETAIPDSLVIVTPNIATPTIWIETDEPDDLYLDWYEATSGARSPVLFEAVLRDEGRRNRLAAEEALADLQAYIAANPPGGGVTDHGALGGLTDDDHPQYFTATRLAAWGYSKEEAASLIANSVAAAAPANRDRGNHTGKQPISSVENLESRLAAVENGTTGGGGGILLLPGGSDVPLGTPPGLVGFIPDDSVPAPTLVETISHDSEGTTVTCAVPYGVQVGDAVIFIPSFDPAVTGGDNITVTDTGWSEILDYSAQQAREVAAYVYRVADSTALAALGATVTATWAGTAARRMGVVFTVPGSLVSSAWPAYTSGSNRSPATVNTPTTTGATIQGFATATVPFHKVVLAVTNDLGANPAASSGFTLVGSATCSTGGAQPRTLTVLIKDLAAAPVPAATVTHPAAASATHGGGQFIVPVAP